MSATLGVFLILAALAASVVLSNKTKINVGIWAMLFTFLIGKTGYGVSNATILSFFPTSLAVTVILACFFFGFVNRTTIFTKLSGNILYTFRNHAAVIPFACVFATWVLYLCGAETATYAIMGPIFYSMAVTLGFDPLLATIGLWVGTGAGMFAIWQPLTALYRTILVDLLGEASGQLAGSILWITITVFLWLIYIASYFVLKGYKVKSSSVEIQKPEPFTPEEKRVLRVIYVFLFFAAVPSVINCFFPNPVTGWFTKRFDISILYLIGAIVMSTMNIESPDVVLKTSVPWSMIVMISGTAMLVKLSTAIGAVDAMSQWIQSLGEFWIVPALTLCSGLLTMAMAGQVAVQTLQPIIVSAAAAFTGLPLFGMTLSTIMGSAAPAVSPFSTGGGLSLMFCPDELRDRTMKRQLTFAFIMVGVVALLAILGGYRYFVL